jgi:hypothetical protein
MPTFLRFKQTTVRQGNKFSFQLFHSAALHVFRMLSQSLLTFHLFFPSVVGHDHQEGTTIRKKDKKKRNQRPTSREEGMFLKGA